jgi:hypothetical protein
MLLSSNQADDKNQMNQLPATRRELGPGIVSCLDSSGPFGSVADFQTIAAGILEKDSVVARPFMVPKAVDIPSSRSDEDLSLPVDLAGAFCPEGDPAFVGGVLRRLSDAKKLSLATRSGRFKLQPALDTDVLCESLRRQECFVEGARLGQTAHPQVNVIVPPPHQWSSQRRDCSRNGQGVESGGRRRHVRGSEINTRLKKRATNHGPRRPATRPEMVPGTFLFSGQDLPALLIH